MTKQVQELIERGDARIVAAPLAPATGPRHQVDADRSFELPTGLYAATVGLYLSFLAIMFTTFSSPGLVLPMVIFALFTVALFATPAIWTRLKDNASLPMTWGRFLESGIMTHTGLCSSRDAAVQMLILPVLIVGWALAIAIIAALV